VSDDLTRYSALVAVDVLDDLVRGETPGAQDVLRAAIALALHGADSPEAIAALCDLERLALGGRGLGADALDRAARVASELRHLVGVH
jgi:hypothetical protein